jgi:antitoxin VapB
MTIMLPIDDETERLARKLAEATGKSLPDVVSEAIAAMAADTGVRAHVANRLSGDSLLARMTEITDGFAHLPILDPRAADEILGYDEHGLAQGSST